MVDMAQCVYWTECACDLYFFSTGLIYLPEIKYRRILNQAFGPGGWALMPRGETLHYQVLIL